MGEVDDVWIFDGDSAEVGGSNAEYMIIMTRDAAGTWVGVWGCHFDGAFGG